MWRFSLGLVLAGASAAQYVDLQGSWKTIAGDDARYAQPGFDDSHWSGFELPRRQLVRLGVHWLRRTATAPNELRDPVLALGWLSHCYDVFVNGTRVGDSGCRPGEQPPFSLPNSFSIPQGVIEPSKPFVVALRTEGRSVRWIQLQNLRDEGPYLLTNAAHAADAVEAARLKLSREGLPWALFAGAQLGIAILLLVLWPGNRERLELLWFSLFLLSVAASNGSLLWLAHTGGEYHAAFPYLLVFGFVFLNCCTWAVLRSEPLPIGLIGAAAAMSFAVRVLFESPLYLAIASALPAWWSLQSLGRGHPAQRYFAMAILLYVAALNRGLAAMVILGWPLGNNTIRVGPFLVPITATISTVVSFVIMILLLRAVGADRREKYRLAAEFEAARGVQQLLLQPGTGSREYPVDAVYLPASEVGGDFYQRLEDGKGGFTIVVGDVSGKGLRAAMLVSMIVGILRQDGRLRPGEILASLNESLVQGMSGGFVTCLCAHFDGDGRVVLANAGHLAPCSGGKEVAVESGLPLGVAPGIAYTETETWLPEGAQVTFVSDGVVEAANARSELFGFERTREFSGKPAREIANAARDWGQNDDITVVTVARRSV
jgi:hypothetical protein